MPTVPTFADLYAVARAEVESRNADLTDWNPGSNLDVIGGVAGMTADEVIRYAIGEFAKQALSLAEGDDLDALVQDRFGSEVSRDDAVAAVVPLTLTRGSSTGVLTWAAGSACTVTVDGVTLTFETDVEAEMAASASTVEVNATCTTAGATGNIASGLTWTVVDPPADDATATVTNAVRASGGTPEETDEQLRAKVVRYYQTLRRGTVAALETGGRTVPGVSFATVDEGKIAPADGGYVSIYIGDPDARANSALTDLVETEIDNWRAAGVEVRTFASEREEIALAMTLTVRRGSDIGVIRTAARTAILGYTNSLAPGKAASGTLYRSQAERRAQNAHEDVYAASVTTPTADTVPTQDYGAIRVLGSALTLTFVEV